MIRKGQAFCNGAGAEVGLLHRFILELFGDELNGRSSTPTFGSTTKWQHIRHSGVCDPKWAKSTGVREMVTIMWSKGYYGAAVRLGYLWVPTMRVKILPSCFALTRKLALWRMDPKHICATHSKILAAYLHSRSRSLNTVVR